jgi:radical SAM superfamily enzyme YgiQ (UPF0313 family)
MSQPLDIVILSVPYTDPIATVAPVLLSACLNKGGVTAKGIDFSIDFYEEFSTKHYWNMLKSQLTLGHIKEKDLPRRAIIDIFKFNKKFLLKLTQHNLKWIGLSIFSAESISYSYLLIYSIRKYLPGVKIVVGGKGSEAKCSVRGKAHSHIYIDEGLADLAVVGDCEHVIAEVIKNNTLGVYTSPSQTVDDLDAAPLPTWDEYDLIRYNNYKTAIMTEPYMIVTASKGCIRKCTFCDVASFWPKYLYRDPTKVANEIITAHKKTGTKLFLFTDNLINGSVSKYRTMNQVLADTIPNTIKYAAYAIFRNKDTMPVEDFALAKRAGCFSWSIGIESGSERVRFELGKKITDEDLDWSANQLAKHDIQQRWLMLAGYPTETDDDFKLTLEMLRRYAHIAKRGLIKASVTPTFMLLNNSPIMQDTALRNSLGLSHNVDSVTNKFWTSTINVNNTFPIRAYRWRTIVNLLDELGYQWDENNPRDKYLDEIDTLEKIYNEQKIKIIPITQI